MDNNENLNIQDPQNPDFDEIAEEKEPRNWKLIWDRIVKVGLGDVMLRVGTVLASIALVLLVVWVMGRFYLQGNISESQAAAAEIVIPTATVSITLPDFELPDPSASTVSLDRFTEIDTTLPEKPRYEIEKYTVVEGDTLFGIAEKYNLEPSTILWGNLYILGDDPHRLFPGLNLNILPQNGVLHVWSAGEGLNGVSRYYGVTPEDIINWPGNNLDAAEVGDFAAPNIEPGTELFVPSGERDFITWSAPRITRDNPAVAKNIGPGACGVIMDGAVGIGTFIWPAPQRFISGYDYSPATNHFAIDIGGHLGDTLYASDNGVIVYSGWNDYGYGFMVVIDHGGGWQTLYAHMSEIYFGCGASVFQGDVIGLMGSTGNSSGPHLHFEMRHDDYGRVDPKLFLQ
ncbi:MAG: LysM peptidoglycan-binding domain-containing M23 family metallopeptidase [Anaerolineaceae bacterium]|nr:LysM peptidoglycan-binding domain-containing M23 family metallopeptidase [Anaerolineaceae bacterium]